MAVTRKYVGEPGRYFPELGVTPTKGQLVEFPNAEQVPDDGRWRTPGTRTKTTKTRAAAARKRTAKKKTTVAAAAAVETDIHQDGVPTTPATSEET